jgi:hypothetical protein
MARILAGRRDVIGRHFFARVCPIDFFTVEGSVLRGRDLGVERGLWPAESARYRVRTTLCDARRERSTEGTWRTCPRPEVRLPEPVGGRSFHAIDFQVDRGDGWSRPVTVYVTREGHRVVGVDR